MASCINRSAPGYDALNQVFKSVTITDNVIIGWQNANNSDQFPTVEQAKEFMNDQKTLFSLKKKNFANTLLNNLRNNRMISRRGNNPYHINMTRPGAPKDTVGNEKDIQFNLLRIRNYLKTNNIPQSAIILKSGGSTSNKTQIINIGIDEDVLTAVDILPESRAWDTPHTPLLIEHLQRVFPGLNINVVGVNEAKAYYESLPENANKKIKDFSKINSFYYNGQVYLVKGRVTNEIAIEEVLHPFIAAVKIDNPDLYENLLEEAKANFPLLNEQIKEAYRVGRKSFPEEQLNEELLTQALARTFNNEFENEPTKSYRDLIKNLLEWLNNLVRDLHKYLTGVSIPPRDISAGATLTDIAKLLNTDSLRFRTYVDPKRSVQYSLTPEKQSVVDKVLKNSVGTQRIVIEKLFSKVVSSQEEIDSLSATDDITNADDIVVLNKQDNKYYSIKTRKVFASSQRALLGSESAEKQQQLDLQIQNDKKALLNALAQGISFEDIQADLQVFDPEQIAQAYRDAQIALQAYLEEDAVAIPEVVVYDADKLIAETIDLLIVHTDGSVGIINFDISDQRRTSQFDYNEGTDKFDDDSFLSMQGIEGLPKRQQLNTRLQMAKRMLTNMGYKITDNPFNTITMHMYAEIKDGKYTGSIEFDGNTKHAESENEYYVNLIMPVNVNYESEQRLNDAIKNEPYSYYDFESYPDLEDVEFNDDSKLINDLLFSEYDTMFAALTDYRKGLMEQKQAVEKLRKNILLDKEKADITENIEYAISMLTLAIESQDVGEANRIYSQLLKDAIRETDKFIDYIQDPKNFDKQEFISYVMNFKMFGKSFEALGSVAKNADLNKAQLALVNTLGEKLTLALGTRTGRGLIDDAVDDYVKALVKKESAREFTQKDLDELIKTAKDIGAIQSANRSLLASEDTLLALMQKIYERNHSKAVERLQADAQVIGAAARRLAKLAPGVDPQKLYDFMLEFDEDGKRTGNYVKQIGRQYDVMHEKLRDPLYDEDGLRYEYRDIDENSPTYKEDLAYNIKLYEKKQAFSQFMAPEVVGPNNIEAKGEYHEYTEEFKNIRKQYETFFPIGDYGVWRKKAGVSDADYLLYKTKYYDTVEYDRMVKQKGVPTGFVEKDHTGQFVKKEHVIVRPIDSMISPKYKEIMNDKSALGLARKQFYDIFTDYFENRYLKMLPPSIAAKMVGSIPLIKSQFYKELSDKPNIVARMWSKTANGFKDFFTEDVYQKRVAVDEDGNLIDSLPIFYVGNTKNEKALQRIEAELAALEDRYEKNEISGDDYRKEKISLTATAEGIRSTPTADQLSGDLGSSLLLFAGMAHNYFTLSEVEDTMKAMLDVIVQREYTPNDSYTNLTTWVKGAPQQRGIKGGSRVQKRAEHFMKAIFYDTDRQRRSVGEKMIDGLMRVTSWSFVAFNVTGNLNNYVQGRINNNIEYLGGRFVPRKNMMRATKEFNSRVMPSIAKTTAYYIKDATSKKYGGNVYNPNKPATKYDAMVSYLRIIDTMKELQEAGSGPAGNGDASKSYLARVLDMGYILNTGFEYALQSKTGIGMTMTVMLKNSKTGEVVNMYDAHDFINQELILRDGFDTVINQDGTEIPYTDDFRYDLRTKIKSINQQIHGNYSYSTRTMMEANFIGRLAAQFHKWVGPAIRARLQKKYFDENLGWMEGRYRSLFVFINHLQKEVRKGNLQFSKIKSEFIDMQKKEVNFNKDQFAQNRLLGAYRTVGELAIFAFTMGMKSFLLGLLGDDDDDDSPIRRRLQNILLYQVDRSKKEMSQFIPIPGTGGLTQLKQMIESPIAATGTLGKLGEALEVTTLTGYEWLTRDSDGEFYSNSKVVYQNRPNKGKLKMNKKWKDVLPIIYSIQKLRSFDERKEYYAGSK